MPTGDSVFSDEKLSFLSKNLSFKKRQNYQQTINWFRQKINKVPLQTEIKKVEPFLTQPS
jgi:hypothetical protein